MSGVVGIAIGLGSCRDDRVEQFEPREDIFRVIAIPDTQCYTRYAPDVFSAQTEWIADNLSELKIVHVVHLGDITDTNSEDEWIRARDSLDTLIGRIGVTLVPGNHDLGDGGSSNSRVSQIDDWFSDSDLGVSGTFDGSVANSYTLVEGNLLFVGLEFAPRGDVVAWANDVLAMYPERMAVLTTHAYLAEDGSRYDHESGTAQQFSPYEYALAAEGDIHDGEQLWEELASRHAGVELVLSGHVPQGFATLLSANPAGGTVAQIMADYQLGTSCDPLGTDGNGYLLVIEFPVVPGAEDVVVRSYSPYLNRFHPHHSFRVRDWR